jgi:23S rRNA pseudouridine2604 synthase
LNLTYPESSAMREKLTAKHPRPAVTGRTPVRAANLPGRKPARPAAALAAAIETSGAKRAAGKTGAAPRAAKPRTEAGGPPSERRKMDGDKPRSARPAGERSDKPRTARPSGDWGDKPRFTRTSDERDSKPRTARPAGERSDKPRAPRTGGDWSDKPRSPRNGDERDSRPRTARVTGERSDKPRAPRTSGDWNDKPRAPRSGDERDSRPRTARATGERSDKPRAPRSTGDWNEKPRFARSSDERDGKPRAPRSFDERGDKPRAPRSGGDWNDKPRFTRAGDERDGKPRTARSSGERGEQARAPRTGGDWNDKPRTARAGDERETRPRSARFGSDASERPRAPRREAARDEQPRPASKRATGDGFRTAQPIKRAPASMSADAGDGLMRLSKRMSELGLCSRREADEWIEQGWVLVDGERVDTLGAKVNAEQRIEIDDAARVAQAAQVTILLHKPVGYVSGQAEDGYAPAATLITRDNHWSGDHSPQRFSPKHLFGLAPAGRLDIDSTGMLVLTQSGVIAKQLIGEHSEIDKEYLVRVRYGERLLDIDQHFPAESLAKLRHGLELDGAALKPAQVSWQNGEQLRFVLREGKKRQIRRMCELVGLEVIGLKRIRMGRVMLGALPQGQWRYLGKDENF